MVGDLPPSPGGPAVLTHRQAIARAVTCGALVAVVAACSPGGPEETAGAVGAASTAGVRGAPTGSPGASTASSASAASTASRGSTTPTATPVHPDALAVSTPVAPDGIPEPGSTGAPSAPPARPGEEAATQRHPFVPTSIALYLRASDVAQAVVETVDTTPVGELRLPADPGHVGWWQSGALSGDAYGSVVLAGHIDSRDRGIGFLARLLRAQPGDEVVLGDAVYVQRYLVVSRRDVPKASLATSTDTFSQSVPGRLVLLTCTGPFDPVTHYPDNLVVTAEPVGTPTPRS